MKTASLFLKKKLDKNIDHFLDNSQLHYLKNVLKVREDEQVNIFNGEGSKYLAKFDGIKSLKVFDIEKRNKVFVSSILVPVLKKNPFEYLLQKSVEIGVNKIFCYISEKNKEKYSFGSELKKIERYREIIKSAFLQSENFHLPQIDIYESIFHFDFSKFQKIVVLDQEAHESLQPGLDAELIISGGEFGFDQNERDIIGKNKVNYLNLGENILRAETAPVAALSRINI